MKSILVIIPALSLLFWSLLLQNEVMIINSLSEATTFMCYVGIWIIVAIFLSSLKFKD